MYSNRHWPLAALLPFLLAFLLAAPTASADTLTVGGTGSSEPIVRVLFDEFRKQTPDASLRHLSPPLGSGGAVKALAAGRIDLAVIGRPMTSDEAQGVGPGFVLGETAFVMASRDGQAGSGFSLDQLASIYRGDLRAWPDGRPIRLILRPAFESDSLTLKGMSPGMDQAVDAAARRPGMVSGDNDFHTLKLIAETPASLGPTTLGMLKSTSTTVVVVPIEGVTPSLASLENGSYRWRKSLIVVLPRQPGALALRFADFLRSPAAALLLRANDYLPGTR